jgi:protein-L-isoaspartate(D-aspartate) O-methyltransferase
MTSARTRARMVARLREQGIRDPVVLEAMAAVPRHLFVEPALASRAYDDAALPIGFGQTISQPYIVARSIELARDAKPLERVLEIGTGCGYQAAVLAGVAREVYSIERMLVLYDLARRNLRQARVLTPRLRHGDGMMGLVEAAPFDAIVAAAAPTDIPQALLEQLSPGGRLIIPVGEDGDQYLTMVERNGAMFRRSKIEAVRFVPMLPGVS